ncbi:hypothetical protein, partial [Zavarzinella formosa]|uniref:hypothetical protein n=1 Tax=Zavarzinella formosa TaxID=360055 RepID=UPI001EE6581E
MSEPLETPGRPLPFDLPPDPCEFEREARPYLCQLRQKFGPGVNATSALQDVMLRALKRQGDSPPPGPPAPGRRSLWP